MWNACRHWAVVGGRPVAAGLSKRTMSGAISTVADGGAALAITGTAVPSPLVASATDPAAAKIARGSRMASPQQNGHGTPRGWAHLEANSCRAACREPDGRLLPADRDPGRGRRQR